MTSGSKKNFASKASLIEEPKNTKRASAKPVKNTASKTKIKKAPASKKTSEKGSTTRSTPKQTPLKKTTTKTTRKKKEQDPTVKKPSAKEKRLVRKKVEERVELIARRKAGKTETESTISLPSTASLRMLEKVKIYRAWYQVNSPRVMRRLAHVGGYLFLFSGATLLSLSWVASTADGYRQIATTVCADGVACNNSQADQSENNGANDNTEETSPYLPKIEFITDLVEPLETNTEIELLVKHSEWVSVFLHGGSSGEVKELDQVRVDGSRQFYILPTETLSSGNYYLKAKAKEIGSDTIHQFTGPDLKILRPQVDDTEEEEDALNADDNDEEEGEEEENEKSDMLDTDHESSDDEVVAGDEETEVAAGVDPTTKSTEEAETDSDDQTTEKNDLDELDDKIAEQTNENSLSFRAELSLQDDPILQVWGESLPFVEVYAVPSLSTSPNFIGLAKKKADLWQFNLNEATIPVGEYKLFASTKIQDSIVRSNYLPYSVKVTNLDPDEVTAEDHTEQVVMVEKVKKVFSGVATTSESIDSELDKRENYFSEQDQNRNSSSTPDSPDYANETELLLSENTDELDALFKHYASAIQSNDEKLIRLSKQKIDEYRESLVVKASIDVRTKDILAQIDEQLKMKFGDLKNKVEKFEKIVSEKTNNITTKDTDGDGISDFDEMTIYKTDPNQSDTDGDGVIDGIEIIGGYDPLDPSREAVIKFHSPKDAGYVSDDILTIDEVNPVVETDVSYGVPVQAEIKGRGLPNSFVTLFIFSEPTIVTVKTDASGAFAYTFTKELADGEHEIYVALTDNTGEIVAQSNPYRFVKTAEAFSPIEIDEKAIVSTGNNDDTTLSAYNIVASMGVVTFGFILLMLGKTLRSRQEDFEINEKDTKHVSDQENDSKGS